MMSRKTQYGWMAVGAMLCLLGIGVALKMRDTNKAVAQADHKVAFENVILTIPTDPPELIPPPRVIDEETAPPIRLVESVPPMPSVPMPPPVDPKPEVTALPTAAPPSPAGPTIPPPPLIAEGPITPPPLPTMQEPPLAPVPQAPEPPKGAWANPRPVEPAPLPPTAIVPVSANTKTDVVPGEPPLAAVAGPLQVYEVRAEETVQEIARRTLGATERWTEIQKLNPTLKAGEAIAKGTLVRLPADAAGSPIDEIDAIKPLPAMRPKSAPTAPKKVLPLTGTYPCTIDEAHVLTLPKALREQLGNCDTILVSPGPDQCLWITNHAHIERLAERLELSPAKEMDVRVFKRLYYAQTEKTPLTVEGKMNISDKLVQFAGLRQDVVLVGIDEHFELWDAAKWRAYTQQKSAEARSAMTERE